MEISRQQYSYQERLVYSYPKAVSFVDGTHIQTFRPVNHLKKAHQHCVNHQFHCFNISLWTGNYGMIIRLNMTLSGLVNDRGLLKRYKQFMFLNQYLSAGNLAI